MTYPLVRDLAADGIPVTVACRVLGFSRQAFYAWDIDPISDHDRTDAHLTNAALDIHHDDPEFGYRFVADELMAAGHLASERRVWRLCSQAGIFSAHSHKRGSGKRPGPPVHDDRLQRDFTSPAPNRLWLTDITGHHTDEGKLYLCAVKDAYSNRIVGYSIDSRMKTRIATTAISSAVARRGAATSWLAASCTPTEAASSDPGASSKGSSTTNSPDEWAASALPAITPRWSHSSRCCRRTS